jgi:hypothetical protein
VIKGFHKTTKVADGLPLWEKYLQAGHAIHFDDLTVRGEFCELGIKPSVDSSGGGNSDGREKKQRGPNCPK